MKRIIVTSHYHLIGTSGAKLRNRCFSLTVLFLTIFILHLLSSSTTAQTTTSTIKGTVTDITGAVVAGAEVRVSGTVLATERSATTDAEGFYRLPALPAGTYTLKVSKTGFATSAADIELTLNLVLTVDVQVKVGNVGEVVNVSAEVLPLLDSNASSTGATVTSRQILELPVNGRDYLDLIQLVPGVAINRHENPGSDNANPVLGERSGNNNFLIDGQPNKDTVNGGAAAQFNQETIAEFQVLTTGFKAEFGQASGAVINVITKSGENTYHGVASLFHRNESFDSVNSLDSAVTDPLHLRRFDYSLALGGLIGADHGRSGNRFQVSEPRRIGRSSERSSASAHPGESFRYSTAQPRNSEFF
jgi:hypothetical protein